ncbi:MAG: hypothetical protein V4674_03630 [Patescibacteria group bacterium]
MQIKLVQTLFLALMRWWPFDAKEYPKLKGKSSAEVVDFALVHMSYHISHRAGDLARIHERHAHHRSALLDKRQRDRMKRLAARVIVSAIRLFVMAGGTPREFVVYATRIHRRHKKVSK